MHASWTEGILMDDESHTCEACGSQRVISGSLGGVADERGRHHGYERPAVFAFSDLKEEHYWTTITLVGTARAVPIQQHGSARLCLDCGTVDASLSADVAQAKKVLDKWATDDLRSRIDAGDEAT
jgi:hypothetical protein